MSVLTGLISAGGGAGGAAADFTLFSAAVRLAAGFLVTAGICVISLWLLRKIQRGSWKKENHDYGSITVVSRAYLSPKKPLYLVRVSNRLLLLADSPGGLTKLTEFNAEHPAGEIDSARTAAEHGLDQAITTTAGSVPGADKSGEDRTGRSPGRILAGGSDFKTIIERALGARRRSKAGRK